MQPAIEIRNLGKQYELATTEPYISLRDVLAGTFKKIIQPKKSTKQKIWALKDIDVNIMPGERVGIIGRNGAGKSTLLKIISRITTPTTGHALIRGRVGSLLEVGTGFHPELTGRENIFLNGSILGLKKTEIRKQLDAIIDFSGVEKFIDTPLKHFSSGMQLRLAFAVAAHLEPEILLIDEVLAVGDIEFQKKCIGKMEEVSKEHGRTILFVSHNMGAITNLCTNAILLSEGQLRKKDRVDKVINDYFDTIAEHDKENKGFGDGKASITGFQIIQEKREVTELFLGYPARFEISFTANEELSDIELAFNIKNRHGEIITHCTTLDSFVKIKAKQFENVIAQAELAYLSLSPGSYIVDIFILNNGEMVHGIQNYREISIINSDKALRPDGFPSHVKTFTETKWHVR